LQRGRSLERVSGRNECTIRPREEDAVGSRSGVSPTVWISLDLPASSQSLWASGQFPPSRVPCNSGPYQEVRGGERRWATRNRGVGRWVSHSRILVCGRRRGRCRARNRVLRQTRASQSWLVLRD